MSLNHSQSIMEETIPENKEISYSTNGTNGNSNGTNGSNTPTSNSGTPDDHHHYNEILAMPHKRIRTLSETERIASGPAYRGVITSFCRNKGHGFIKPNDGSEPIFVHISDIEGEWCPKEGDMVSYKKTLVPPKCVKYQAVHVNFVHLKEGVRHEHWDEAPPK